MPNINSAEVIVIILHNCKFYKKKSIINVENIGLIFLLQYSPKLNPPKLVWLNIKKKTTNKVYKTIEELKLKLDEIVQELINEKLLKK